MSNPIILSGKKVSEQVYSDLSLKIKSLKEKGIVPGLAVILVGEDPASKIYVRSKTKVFKKLGLYTKTYNFPNNIEEVQILNLIAELNRKSSIHGILVQLPLPKQINPDLIINKILPEKDVDGFHPENAGLLSIGKPRFIPCTPKGIMKIMEYYNISLKNKHVVVIGRSNIVGRPISILTSLKTQFADGTTTICHSGTKDIEYFTRNADVIIAALGIPEFLKKSMVKNGSVIIDVGINRMDADNQKGYNIVGDTKFDDLKESVSAITPVPGGVGPMTIAMLVENTIEASETF